MEFRAGSTSMVETAEQREALMNFYSSLYGWTWEVGEEQMGYYSIANHDGAPVMGLGQGPGCAGRDGAVLRDRRHQRLGRQGGRTRRHGLHGTDGGSRSRHHGDGERIPPGPCTVCGRARNFKGFGVAYEANAPGWFDHASSDPAAAAAYYQGLTGHSIIEPEPGMRVLTAGEQWFASISENQVAERPDAQWNSIYVVETLEAARNKVRELGGTIVLEEMPVPGSAISVFIEPVMNTAVTIMGAGSPSNPPRGPFPAVPVTSEEFDEGARD